MKKNYKKLASEKQLKMARRVLKVIDAIITIGLILILIWYILYLCTEPLPKY